MQNKENFASRTYPKRRTAWSIEQQQIENYGHRFETTRGKNMEARRQLGEEKYSASRSTTEEEQSQRGTQGMERGALQQCWEPRDTNERLGNVYCPKAPKGPKALDKKGSRNSR